jgi:hypothetical protein
LVLRLLILKIEVDYNGRCETHVGIAGQRSGIKEQGNKEQVYRPPHGK